MKLIRMKHAQSVIDNEDEIMNELLKFDIDIECTANTHFKELKGCKEISTIGECLACSFSYYDEKDMIAKRGYHVVNNKR